jgi:RNA 2',3'-cyclic 3'-phosphodiesterase
MGKAATRVFIGIPAGEALCEQVQEFRNQHAGLHVRWIKPENLHLTIIPPWESGKTWEVCDILGQVASCFQKSNAVFTSVKPGPVASMPSLIWATGKAPPLFADLRDALYTRLPVVSAEQRPFLLHMTIARVSHKQLNELSGTMFEISVKWDAAFSRLCLYESILKPSGAEYRILCEAPFGMKTT